MPRTHITRSFSDSMGRLTFSPTRGFMKGFMDMVFHFKDRFYIVDWKSNHLGNRMENYASQSLLPVMVKDFYILQYHIYTLALDQYLRLRIHNYRYEDHFGGVFYIFLRGIDPEKGPDSGIYRDLPAPEVIHKLRETLLKRP